MPMLLKTTERLVYDFNGHVFSYRYYQNKGQFCINLENPFYTRKETEIYVRSLPRDVSALDLFQYFAIAGPIYDLRLLIDFSGYNRGYCYVRYLSKKAARKAVSCLNDILFNGTRLIFDVSVNNTGLLLKNVPSYLDVEEVLTEEPILLDGLINTKETLQTERDFKLIKIQYICHQKAAAVRKLLWPEFAVNGQNIKIDWIVPKGHRQGHKVELRNLDEDAMKIDIYEAFAQLADPTPILSIYKNGSSGFIIFENSLSAQHAYNIIKGPGLKIGRSYANIFEPPIKVDRRIFLKKAAWSEQQANLEFDTLLEWNPKVELHNVSSDSIHQNFVPGMLLNEKLWRYYYEDRDLVCLYESTPAILNTLRDTASGGEQQEIIPSSGSSTKEKYVDILEAMAEWSIDDFLFDDTKESKPLYLRSSSRNDHPESFIVDGNNAMIGVHLSENLAATKCLKYVPKRNLNGYSVNSGISFSDHNVIVQNRKVATVPNCAAYLTDSMVMHSEEQNMQTGSSSHLSLAGLVSPTLSETVIKSHNFTSKHSNGRYPTAIHEESQNLYSNAIEHYLMINCVENQNLESTNVPTSTNYAQTKNNKCHNLPSRRTVSGNLTLPISAYFCNNATNREEFVEKRSLSTSSATSHNLITDPKSGDRITLQNPKEKRLHTENRYMAACNPTKYELQKGYYQNQRLKSTRSDLSAKNDERRRSITKNTSIHTLTRTNHFDEYHLSAANDKDYELATATAESHNLKSTTIGADYDLTASISAKYNLITPGRNLTIKTESATYCDSQNLGPAFLLSTNAANTGNSSHAAHSAQAGSSFDCNSSSSEFALHNFMNLFQSSNKSELDVRSSRDYYLNVNVKENISGLSTNEPPVKPRGPITTEFNRHPNNNNYVQNSTSYYTNFSLNWKDVRHRCETPNVKARLSCPLYPRDSFVERQRFRDTPDYDNLNSSFNSYEDNNVMQLGTNPNWPPKEAGFEDSQENTTDVQESTTDVLENDDHSAATGIYVNAIPMKPILGQGARNKTESNDCSNASRHAESRLVSWLVCSVYNMVHNPQQPLYPLPVVPGSPIQYSTHVLQNLTRQLLILAFGNYPPQEIYDILRSIPAELLPAFLELQFLPYFQK